MTRLTLAATGQHVCETDAGVTVHVEPLGAINAYLAALGISPIAYKPFEDCAYQTTSVTFTRKSSASEIYEKMRRGIAPTREEFNSMSLAAATEELRRFGPLPEMSEEEWEQ